MPAGGETLPLNATPEFNRAMEKYSSARSIHEKIAALQEALAALPKHKGAENMRAFLLRRLSELRRELEKRKRAAGGGRQVLIPKEGFQAVLFGFPNSGKSYILKTLTGAPAEVTDYPLSTTEPVPGMMDAGGGKLQLVEVPSYFPGYGESKIGRLGLAAIRAADFVILVIDLTEDPETQYRELSEFLEGESIFLNRDPPNAKVEKKYSGGITFVGESFMTAPREVYVNILQSAGIHHATVTFLEKTPPENLMLVLDDSARFIPAIALGNKAGLAPEENVERFKKLPLKTVIFDPDRVGETKEAIFSALGLIRVYTKPPRSEVSKIPVVMRKGATVEDLAREIAPKRTVRSARVWGSTKYPGQNVSRDYVLRDGDIVELHF